MAWQTISENDLLQKISGSELAAFRAAVLGNTQGDPVAECITNQVETARGYIARNINNLPLNAGETVPHKLVGPVTDLIILDIMSRAAGTVIDPDNIRRKNAERATALLRDVARAMFVIEEATTADTEALSYARPSIHTHGHHRQYGRHAEREF